MKKIIAFILCLVFILTALPVYASETQEASEESVGRVEISFQVGDDTLLINETEVTVEKPYVVGVGVTLVPLRVITEAFGAEVEWFAETKSIHLTYPDVEILLQINNPIAEVNGKAETLLSAPELTPNGFTMVPLRFISETFGAQVSYDEVTKLITVVKETPAESGDMVTGGAQEKLIGDSFYGWTMDNFADMQLADRDFDGTYTMFVYNGNIIIVYIDIKPDGYDFERDFIEYKTAYSDGYTLVKAEKDSEHQTMHFRFKDKEFLYEDRMIVTDKYIFSVCGEYDAAETALRDECFDIVSSFSPSFSAEDTYDLSNVSDGMRLFESDTMGYSIEIPEGYSPSGETGIGNEMFFYDYASDILKGINISIYSKSEFGSAKLMSEEIYEKSLLYFNEAVFDSEEISESTYDEYHVYEYAYDINTSAMEVRGRDAFLEIGEYVYNIGVMVDNNAEADSLIDRIIGSFEAEEIDPEEMGILLYDRADNEGKYICGDAGWSMVVPNAYTSDDVSADSVTLMHEETGVTVSFQKNVMPVETDFNTVSEYVKNTFITQGYTHLSSNSTVINGVRFADMIFTYEDDEMGKIYMRHLVAYNDSKVYMLNALFTDIMYSEYSRAQVDAIFKSFKTK